ncbi:uncharacterized protein LOC114186294 [Vigna unguiculata]|uniref:uncharacterized protein LOC114186294 n=1 Tax=Vigna unguiculata TaxID=3917 RepID=UPI00101708C1|nr:uncharacterized protein LOC114186294 [Vigna unguiculata]
MKKQGSTRFLMWVMICVHVYLVIAAVSLSESNDSTSVCNGSVEDCHHLDSQLPTVSSSHFRRILAAGPNGQKTAGTPNPNEAAVMCPSVTNYQSCLPPITGQRVNCGQFNRGC